MKKERAAAKYAALYADVLARDWGRDRDEAYARFHDTYLGLDSRSHSGHPSAIAMPMMQTSEALRRA